MADEQNNDAQDEPAAGHDSDTSNLRRVLDRLIEQTS